PRPGPAGPVRSKLMLVDCGGAKRRGSLSKLFSRRNSRESIVSPIVGDKTRAGESSSESSGSPVDAVLENGDLAFQLSAFLVSSSEGEDLSSLCCVSKGWTRTFALARSQLRWDSLHLRIKADEKQGDLLVYHSLSYALERDGRIALLTLCSSNLVDACDKAKMEYLRKQLDDSQRDESRRRYDNPDYFYEAHKELPTSASFVLPRPPTCLKEDVRIRNKIQYDKAPRLVNRYETSLVSDIVGMRNTAMAGGSRSEEGSWDLGYAHKPALPHDHEGQTDLGSPMDEVLPPSWAMTMSGSISEKALLPPKFGPRPHRWITLSCTTPLSLLALRSCFVFSDFCAPPNKKIWTNICRLHLEVCQKGTVNCSETPVSTCISEVGIVGTAVAQPARKRMLALLPCTQTSPSEKGSERFQSHGRTHISRCGFKRQISTCARQQTTWHRISPYLLRRRGCNHMSPPRCGSNFCLLLH
ncbi:hypothetical protein THAOC_02913, partial [Thalassiosira oceanica]